MSKPRGKGIGGHQSANAKTTTWVTPKEIIDALGPFDLDPCSFTGHPWPAAAENWALPEQNGLELPWHGTVWVNPPYGSETIKWLEKLAQHGDGIALVFARTETEMFRKWVYPFCDGILFLYGRIHFCDDNGVRSKHNSGAPSCIIAYGEEALTRLRESKLNGALMLVDDC